MSEFILNINGERKRVKVDGEMPLLWVLRDTLGYTGTKFGCGRGLCGACTIHIDGEATRSCVTAIDSIDEDENKNINQIKDLQAKSSQLRFQLDQVSVAQTSFTNSLIASLKDTMDSLEDSEENKSESQNAG